MSTRSAAPPADSPSTAQVAPVASTPREDTPPPELLYEIADIVSTVLLTPQSQINPSDPFPGLPIGHPALSAFARYDPELSAPTSFHGKLSSSLHRFANVMRADQDVSRMIRREPREQKARRQFLAACKGWETWRKRKAWELLEDEVWAWKCSRLEGEQLREWMEERVDRQVWREIWCEERKRRKREGRPKSEMSAKEAEGHELVRRELDVYAAIENEWEEELDARAREIEAMEAMQAGTDGGTGQ